MPPGATGASALDITSCAAATRRIYFGSAYEYYRVPKAFLMGTGPGEIYRGPKELKVLLSLLNNILSPSATLDLVKDMADV